MQKRCLPDKVSKLQYRPSNFELGESGPLKVAKIVKENPINLPYSRVSRNLKGESHRKKLSLKYTFAVFRILRNNGDVLAIID